ncbi:hypothetical protein P0O15_00320 [Methanotrichaceae archaeon Mx]|uniref:Uncharacterized protein n=1 Tax=Candidatus Methanocrinis natronophilus TaxID=3033396 RepID=A0ABT5X4K4_9EURY|nr:hypothetical protein [Candidatus Methanocrinis natronophilus]
MVSIGTMIRISAALLVMLAVSAPAWATDNPAGYYIKNTQTLEQDVEGEGYAMVYQKVNTKTLQFKNYMHGSGSMDAAILLSSNQSASSTRLQDQNTLAFGASVTTRNSDISFVEQNEMTYSPMAMVYGTGWYERNPIIYNSKLKERTEAKNYDGSACSGDSLGVSMLHQIEYASAFKKDIAVKLKNEEKSSGHSSSPKDGLSSTSMRIEEEVIEGAVHVGQILTKLDSKQHGWKNPLVEIDENYHGTFRIKKEMEISTDCRGSKPREDWLSCCFGGYEGIHEDDKMWGEKEVFDSTCRDEAWGKTWEDKSKAQYCKEC